MDLDLVGYLLGSLASDERRQVEIALRDDPSARRRLDRLRTVLSPLNSLRGEDSLPPGLAERTVAYVLAHVEPPVPDGRPTPARRVEVPSDRPVFVASRWRRADAIVAACILVVVGGLALSAFSRVKHRHEIVACQNNLRQLYHTISNYSDQHQGRFPQVQDQPPYNQAGAFVHILKDAGLMTPSGVPDCPAVVQARTDTQAPMGYAYTLGYRDGRGQLHGLRRDDNPFGNDVLPILSDVPDPASHGTGYNVLNIGGNVRYCTSPNVGVDGDNIFLNQDAAVRAGLHRLDTVLGGVKTRP